MAIDKLGVFLRAVDFTPEGPQLALLRWLISGERQGPRAIRKLIPRRARNLRLLLWGRGSGKSSLSVLCSLYVALAKPGTQVIYASPSVDQTTGTLMRYAKRFCEPIKNELQRYDPKDFLRPGSTTKILSFKNSSEIRFVSNRSDAIRSFGPRLLIMDEVQSWPWESIEGKDIFSFIAAIRPRMIAQHKTDWTINLCGTRPPDAGPLYSLISEPKKHNITVIKLPTWRVRPSINRSLFRDLPEDERLREIECEPASGQDAVIPLDLIDRAECSEVPQPETAPILAIDQATRHDRTGYAVISRKHGGGGALDQYFVHELRRQRTRRDLQDFLAVVKSLQERWRPRKITMDQFGCDPLIALLRTHGIEAQSHAWTVKNRDQSFVNFRELLQNGQVFLPRSDALRREVAGLRITYLRSGHRRIEHSSEGDDQLFALMLGLEDLRTVAEPMVWYA